MAAPAKNDWVRYVLASQYREGPGSKNGVRPPYLYTEMATLKGIARGAIITQQEIHAKRTYLRTLH